MEIESIINIILILILFILSVGIFWSIWKLRKIILYQTKYSKETNKINLVIEKIKIQIDYLKEKSIEHEKMLNIYMHNLNKEVSIGKKISESLSINKKVNLPKKNKYSNITKCTIQNKFNKKNLEIFKYIDHINVYRKSYLGNNKECFSKEIAKEALFEYLYTGKKNEEIEFEFIPNMNSKRARHGATLAHTLAYYQISTSGQKRMFKIKGVNEKKSRQLINNLVNNIN